MTVVIGTFRAAWSRLAPAAVLLTAILVQACGETSEWETGDAPDPSYPSLVSSDGARHADVTRAWLGDGVDAESDSRQVDGDLFDDGLVRPDPVTVLVTNNDWGGLLVLNILVDLNKDGDWEDVGEWAVQNWKVNVPKGQSRLVGTSIDLPASTWMRVTLSAATLSSYTGRGGFKGGETEDYILPPPPTATPALQQFRRRLPARLPFRRLPSAVNPRPARPDVSQARGSSMPSVSADGRFVAFYSIATDVVPGDTNGLPDVFLHDRLTGVTERVSVATDGSQAEAGVTDLGYDGSFNPRISSDGRFVVSIPAPSTWYRETLMNW